MDDLSRRDSYMAAQIAEYMKRYGNPVVEKGLKGALEREEQTHHPDTGTW